MAKVAVAVELEFNVNVQPPVPEHPDADPVPLHPENVDPVEALAAHVIEVPNE